MQVDIAGVGFLSGEKLQAWFKEMQTVVALAQWFDKQDMTKLPSFQVED